MKNLFKKKTTQTRKRRFKQNRPSSYDVLLSDDASLNDPSANEADKEIDHAVLEEDAINPIAQDFELPADAPPLPFADVIAADAEKTAVQENADSDLSIFTDLISKTNSKAREETAFNKRANRIKPKAVRRKFNFKKLQNWYNSIVAIFKPRKDFKRQILKGKKSHFRKRSNNLQILYIGAAAVCTAVIFLFVFGSGPSSTSASVKDGSAAVTLSLGPTGLSPSLSPIPTPEPSLGPGVTSLRVVDLQQRLMDLDYMSADEPTDYYGPQTRLAVELFQRKHNLVIDGIAGDQTITLLNSSEAKPYTVSLGVSGTDVKELQSRLVELGYMGEATGYYGEVTEEAVNEFQKRNGLTVDGTVGEETLEMLYSEDAKAYSVSSGMSGDEVKTLQERLKKLGYLSVADGTFGKETVEAVKRFQTVNGLIADGHIGPQTKSVLYSRDAQSDALVIGDSGTIVENVQKQLIKLKYMTKATGYYGESTESAVKAFQKRNSLTADGKVGSKTMNTLFSSSAKAAAPTSSGNNSGNNNGGTSGGSSDQSTLEKFISIAESKLGSKYVRGAKGPNSFDCSGFAYWCLNQAGVRQGYLTSYAWRTYNKYTRITNMGDIKRGDIIIYKMGSRKGHVAIAISNTMMIDASSGNGQVVKRSFTSSYWHKVFYCAYRVF
ncbi:MAG: C40 family peptidase [Christensenellales bacterium]